MKRIFILLFVVILLSPLSSYAYDTSEQNDAARLSGADKLPDNEYITETEKSGEEINIGDKIFAIIRDSVSSFFRSGLEFFCVTVAFLIIASVLSAFGKADENRVLQNTYNYVSVLLLSGIMFSFLEKVFSYAADSINRLCVFMASLIPVTASLYALGGCSGTGIASSSALLVFLSAAENFSGIILMPLLRVGFVAAVTASLPGNVDLRSVTSFLKNSLTTLLAFVFTIFGVVMYFQTSITAAADSYAFRTVKFASGVFIPVIGNIVGEAARTVTSAVGVVKASVGAIGLVTVFALTLPAVIYTVMYKVFVLLGAMLGRMLGLEKESGLLYDINGFLSVLMALLIGMGTIFIISVALFIKMGIGQ